MMSVDWCVWGSERVCRGCGEERCCNRQHLVFLGGGFCGIAKKKLRVCMTLCVCVENKHSLNFWFTLHVYDSHTACMYIASLGRGRL